MDATLTELASVTDPSALPAFLASVIQRVAAREPNKIGTDVMTVTIPRPAMSRQIGVRFFGAPSSSGSYLPWIVCKSSIVRPSPAGPGWHIPFDDVYTVMSYGPEGFGFGPATTRRRAPRR